MKEDQVSRTALFTGFIRGYHATHDDLKIFDDFLAFSLLTEEERAAMEDQLLASLHSADPACASSFPDRRAALRWLMQRMAGLPITLGRSRYTEECLERVVGEGVRQYVILGAGMDSFSFRRPDLVERLQVFEVDHPATQDFKRRRIAELGWKDSAQLHYVPLDFTRGNLAAALISSSYDLQEPTFFSWLGVTYYLSRQAVSAALRAIADIAPEGSMVIFDYLDADAFIPEKAAPRVHFMLRSVQEMDEPMQTGFDPPALAAELETLGLRLQEDLSPLDIQRLYFMGRTDHLRASEHAHYVRAEVISK